MAADAVKKSGALKATAIVAVLLIAAIIAIPFILDINQFRPEIQSRLSAQLGRDVRIGDLDLSILSGGIQADTITIADHPAFSSSPFLSSKSLKAGVELLPLVFSRKVRITSLSLDRPQIRLIQSSSGMWNFSDLGKTAGAEDETSRGESSQADISVKELKITGGRIIITGGRGNPVVYDDVNILARDLSYDSSFPFSLSASLPGGGALKLEGKAGPLNPIDAIRTPMTAGFEVRRFDFAASGFAGPDSGVSGILDFDGTAASDGKRAESRGSAVIEKFQLVSGGSPARSPVSLQYTLQYDLANRNGILSEGKLECGKAVAHLNGTYAARGDKLALKMKVQGSDMPVQDLTPLLPAFRVFLPRGASLQGGSLNAALSAEGPADKIVVAGTVEITGTRLEQFDLGGKMAVLSSLAGIQSSNTTEIEKFFSRMTLTPEGTEVQDLLLIAPALGELSGAGRIDADQSLDFSMRAALKPSGALGAGLSRLLRGGAMTVPFLVRGTVSDPKFLPDVRGAGRSLPGSESEAVQEPSDSGATMDNILRGILRKK